MSEFWRKRARAGHLAEFALCFGLSVAVGACVSQDVEPAHRAWTLTSDSLVAVPSEAAQDAAASLPAPSVPAPSAQDLLSLITPATARDLEPDFLDDQPPSPFHRLGRDVIRGIDGSWSKLYTLKKERSDGVIKMLQATVAGFPTEPNTPSPADGAPTEIIRWVLHPNFYSDSVFTSVDRGLGVLQPLPNLSIADLFVVTAPPETLLFIDQLLGRLLADLPQIEIEVRVVEINLDDLIEWDSKIGFSQLTDNSLPFNSTTNPPAGSFGSGFPILDGGVATGFGGAFGSFKPSPDIAGFLLSLQGVHKDLDVKAVLSLLQTIGASELISSPTVTVLNGHRALINTGSRVPVFQATGVGNNLQITTKFEETGVRVEIIPFIVGEDVLRIDLSVDVSAVTAEIPLVLAGTQVLTPVISARQAGTTVHVHSGQVLAVGGLRARESIESITKVPFLGDIPILGWLFKSRASRMRNSEIVFFITPRIRIPSETLLAPLDR
ncbi:MAG: type II secretion system protein GspD [Planctomycetota bacterium]